MGILGTSVSEIGAALASFFRVPWGLEPLLKPARASSAETPRFELLQPAEQTRNLMRGSELGVHLQLNSVARPFPDNANHDAGADFATADYQELVR